MTPVVSVMGDARADARAEHTRCISSIVFQESSFDASSRPTIHTGMHLSTMAWRNLVCPINGNISRNKNIGILATVTVTSPTQADHTSNGGHVALPGIGMFSPGKMMVPFSHFAANIRSRRVPNGNTRIGEKPLSTKIRSEVLDDSHQGHVSTSNDIQLATWIKPTGLNGNMNTTGASVMSLDMITDKADRTLDGNQGHISSPSIGMLPLIVWVTCLWHLTAKSWNKQMHSLHGNNALSIPQEPSHEAVGSLQNTSDCNFGDNLHDTSLLSPNALHLTRKACMHPVNGDMNRINCNGLHVASFSVSADEAGKGNPQGSVLSSIGMHMNTKTESQSIDPVNCSWSIIKDYHSMISAVFPVAGLHPGALLTAYKPLMNGNMSTLEAVGLAVAGMLPLLVVALLVVYLWHLTAKAWNALMHAMNGNMASTPPPESEVPMEIQGAPMTQNDCDNWNTILFQADEFELSEFLSNQYPSIPRATYLALKTAGLERIVKFLTIKKRAYDKEEERKREEEELEVQKLRLQVELKRRDEASKEQTGNVLLAQIAEKLDKLGDKFDTQSVYSFDRNLQGLDVIGKNWSKEEGIPSLISKLKERLLPHLPLKTQIPFYEDSLESLAGLNHAVQAGVAATSLALTENEPQPAGAIGERPSGTVRRSDRIAQKYQNATVPTPELAMQAPRTSAPKGVSRRFSVLGQLAKKKHSRKGRGAPKDYAPAPQITPRKLASQVPDDEGTRAKLTAATSMRSYGEVEEGTERKDMSQRCVQKSLIDRVSGNTKLDSQGTPAFPVASDEEMELFCTLQEVTNRLLLSLPLRDLKEIHNQEVFQACCNIVAKLVFVDRDCEGLVDCRAEAGTPGLKYYLLDRLGAVDSQPILYSGWGDLDLSVELDGLGRVSMLLVEMKRYLNSSRHLSQLFGQVCSAHLHHQGSTKFDILELNEVTSHPILGVLTNGVALLRCRYAGVDPTSNKRMFTMEDLVQLHGNVYAAMFSVFQEVKHNIDTLKATFLVHQAVGTVNPSPNQTPSLLSRTSDHDGEELACSKRKSVPLATKTAPLSDSSNAKRPSGTVVGKVHRVYVAHWYHDLLERADVL